MGSVAASGGYWIATAGDIIFAEPSTITGSIGVFGILPSFEGSLERLGIGADGVRTTPLSGEPDLLRGPVARGRPAAADGRRGDLPPLRRPGRAGPPAAAGAGQRDRPGPGLGRRHRPPARPGRPLRLARRRHRRGGAAGRISTPEDARAVYLEEGPDFWAQLLDRPARRRRAQPRPARRLRPHRPPARGDARAGARRRPARCSPARRSRRAASNARRSRRSAAPARREARSGARLLAALWRG